MMRLYADSFKWHMCATLLFFSLNVNAQSDIDLSFEEFVAQSNREFEEFKERENREFAEFLRKEWEEFQTFITPTPLKKPRVLPKKEPSPDTSPALPTKVDPVKVNPIPDKPKDNDLDTKPAVTPVIDPVVSTYPNANFEYCRTKVCISYDPKMKFALSGVDERAIADAWSRISQTDFETSVVFLKQCRSSLSLSDWGFYRLVYQFCSTIHAKQRNESLFLTNYILNQVGYASQLARSGGVLLLLLHIEDVVYAHPYLTIDGRKFVLFAGEERAPLGSLFTYSHGLKGADAAIRMSYTEVPNLAIVPAQVELPNPWKGGRLRLEVNRSLMDYYTSFPQMQAVNYLYPKPSPVLLQLQSILRPALVGKSKNESVSVILDFVQKTFEYKTDNDQFGYERWFFPDETLFYPFSDCEDRSILFAHLVESMLGMKVALLLYPNHMAAAVSLDQGAPGIYFNVNNCRYTLCDPTYIGAGIGECMPDFKGVSPEIMLYN